MLQMRLLPSHCNPSLLLLHPNFTLPLLLFVHLLSRLLLWVLWLLQLGTRQCIP
jgi:hypothetical protein